VTTRAQIGAHLVKRRIDFLSADAAAFNVLRDQWRSAASSCSLSKAGLRVATVLPGYVNREYGYAFPTDRDLADDIAADETTVKRGLRALEGKGLIERETKAKRNDSGVVVGRVRRIYLTAPERTVMPFQPKGHSPKGQAQPKGQKRATEGSYGCPYIPDRTTPDKEIGSGEGNLGAYVPAREGCPVGYSGDDDFLDTFDRILIETAGFMPIGPAEIDLIVQRAFDKTTDSSALFMPFHWKDVRALRSGNTAEWFRRRTGQLIDRRAA
jgi:DNA-binding MarR family transcriptional regulator